MKNFKQLLKCFLRMSCASDSFHVFLQFLKKTNDGSNFDRIIRAAEDLKKFFVINSIYEGISFNLVIP